jgi:nucleoside-diphosphate-sugar epimerase
VAAQLGRAVPVSGRVVVTGASGFIGRDVVTALQARGDKVVAVEHRWTTTEDFLQQIAPGPIDRCIHLGWQLAPNDAATNLTNFQSSLQLLSALSKSGCGHFLGVGSGVEYAPQNRPCRESDPVGPTDAYGLAKAALMSLLESESAPVGFPNAWARVFTAVGPGERSGRLFSATVRGALLGTPVPLTSGEQAIDVVAVDDVAAGLLSISDARLDGTWNVSTGSPHQVFDLAQRLATRAGDPSVLRFGALPQRPGERRVFSGSPERLEMATGWRARIGIDELVDRMVSAGRAALAQVHNHSFTRRS